MKGAKLLLLSQNGCCFLYMKGRSMLCLLTRNCSICSMWMILVWIFLFVGNIRYEDYGVRGGRYIVGVLRDVGVYGYGKLYTSFEDFGGD
jgi:hypothetical protein